MRESVTYKAIRRLLQKTSLKREKSDWEKMNDMLDQHLPIDPSAGGGGSGAAGSPFNFTIPVIVVGIVILATTAFIFSRSGKLNKTGKSVQIETMSDTFKTQTNNKISNGSNNNIQADDSLQKNLKEYKTLPDSMQGNLTKHLTSLPNKMVNHTRVSDPEKSTTFNNTVVKKNGAWHVNNANHNKKLFEGDQINNTTTHNSKANYNNTILVVPASGYPLTVNSKNRLNNPLINAENPKKFGISLQARTEASVAGISATNQKKHHLYKSDLTYLIAPIATDHNFLKEEKFGKPHLNTSILAKTSKGNNIRNQPDSSDNNNNADKKKTASPDMNRSFKYGLTLPLFQVYNAAGVQSTRLNYIPGITAGYMFNEHLGLGVNILPYQTVNVNSNDSISGRLLTDTTNGRNKTTTNTYYVSNLNTFHAGLHFIYQLNPRFGFEIGLGYQHFYSGNGHTTTQIKDSTSSSIFNENIHYSTGDSASVNIGKSNLNYYLNAVYSINKWNILLGYNLNSKSWITVPGSKSFGWINLEIRYYFSTSGKK